MKRSPIWWSLPAVVALFCVAQFSTASGQIVEIPTRADNSDQSAVGPEQVAGESLRLEIKRSAHRVTLYRDDVALRTYPIAVGRAGWETPLGTFQIYQMIRDPAWEHPLTGKVFPPGDPGNELGHYWIGFAKDGDDCIGFHGTPHPKTVGKAISHGCIRMYEKDIEELFLQVTVGTIVTVVP